MSNKSFITDEHAPNDFLNALRREGFTITVADEEFGEETDDEDDIIQFGLDNSAVILTNDRDFKALDERGVEHNGIIIYYDYTFVTDDIGDAVAAMKNFDETMAGRSTVNHRSSLREWVPSNR